MNFNNFTNYWIRISWYIFEVMCISSDSTSRDEVM